MAKLDELAFAMTTFNKIMDAAEAVQELEVSGNTDVAALLHHALEQRLNTSSDRLDLGVYNQILSRFKTVIADQQERHSRHRVEV